MSKLTVAALVLLVFSVTGVGLLIANTDFYLKHPKLKGTKVRITEYGAVVQPEQPPAESAQAVVEAPVYNFGLMDPHTTSRHEFVIRNTGAGELRLTNEGTSCKKCTIAGISRGAVPPGEDAVVTIEWNCGSGPHYSQSATIGTNDPRQRSLQLRVEGRVRMYLGAEPDELVLESVHPGRSATTETILYSQTVAEPKITEIRGSRAGFTWEVLPPSAEDLQRLEALWARRLVIHTPADLPTGRFEESVMLKLETPGGDKETTDISVRVIGKVKRNVSIYGDISERGVIEGGVVSRADGRILRLKAKVNDDVDRDLHLREIHVTPDFVKCTVTRTPGVAPEKGLYDLTIEIPAGGPVCNCIRGDDLGQIRLVTDHPRIGEVPLILQFAVREFDE